MQRPACDGRLVIYDFGCLRSFDSASVSAFAALVDAPCRDDVEGQSSALEALGAIPPKDASHVRTLLRGFFAPLLVAGPHRIEAGAGHEMRTLFRDKRGQLSLPERSCPLPLALRPPRHSQSHRRRG